MHPHPTQRAVRWSPRRRRHAAALPRAALPCCAGGSTRAHRRLAEGARCEARAPATRDAQRQRGGRGGRRRVLLRAGRLPRLPARARGVEGEEASREAGRAARAPTALERRRRRTHCRTDRPGRQRAGAAVGGARRAPARGPRPAGVGGPGAAGRRVCLACSDISGLRVA